MTNQVQVKIWCIHRNSNRVCVSFKSLESNKFYNVSTTTVTARRPDWWTKLAKCEFRMVRMPQKVNAFPRIDGIFMLLLPSFMADGWYKWSLKLRSCIGIRIKGAMVWWSQVAKYSEMLKRKLKKSCARIHKKLNMSKGFTLYFRNIFVCTYARVHKDFIHTYLTYYKI